MKKFVSQILLILLLISTLILPAQANDLPLLSDWAEDDANKAETAGLFIKGQHMHGDLRLPGRRSQSVAFAVQLAETMVEAEIENTSSAVFQDMLGSSFRKISEKAYSARIANGYGNGYFHPFDSVTREQYICMLLQYAEKELYVEILLEFHTSSLFQDLDTVSDWEKSVSPKLGITWNCKRQI